MFFHTIISPVCLLPNTAALGDSKRYTCGLPVLSRGLALPCAPQTMLDRRPVMIWSIQFYTHALHSHISCLSTLTSSPVPPSPVQVTAGRVRPTLGPLIRGASTRINNELSTVYKASTTTSAYPATWCSLNIFTLCLSVSRTVVSGIAASGLVSYIGFSAPSSSGTDLLHRLSSPASASLFPAPRTGCKVSLDLTLGLDTSPPARESRYCSVCL